MCSAVLCAPASTMQHRPQRLTLQLPDYSTTAAQQHCSTSCRKDFLFRKLCHSGWPLHRADQHSTMLATSETSGPYSSRPSGVASSSVCGSASSALFTCQALYACSCLLDITAWLLVRYALCLLLRCGHSSRPKNYHVVLSWLRSQGGVLDIVTQ